MTYEHKKIEAKWQKRWEESNLYAASNDYAKKKYFALIEFPYPSGAGLHVGHPRPYIGLDVVARKRRMEGYNVLYPIGWDAFGLPTENYAIKTGRNPKDITKENTDTFRRQIKSLGISFDWTREINTTDPAYYRWTQWLFLQFYKHDLAYKAKTLINWCPKDKIGLANEEVVDGKCERCGTVVEKREKEQWMLRITKYADRLYADLDTVDYIERAKLQQRNWIAPSEGAEIIFPLADIEGQDDGTHSVTVFTTRPDTIFGATYVAISPETAQKWITVGWKANTDVLKYVDEALRRRVTTSRDEVLEKTGVPAGISAINPATKEKIPVWVSDYVLGEVGTGALMAVPAHDERDFEFATKFNLVISPVIETEEPLPFANEGVLKNSGEFSGMMSGEAKKKITDFVGGTWKTTYKLRDWVFSRQRYWGEPIPVVHCEKCGIVPLPEEQLPLILPDVENYQPTDTGESPLANITEWVNTTCPKCNAPAKRETDTMPNWAGSSWYYLRYTDPHNTEAFAGKDALDYWTPVDWYNGGMEHTVLHLLYSRFWHKFLFDIGLVPTSEPYQKRTSHGVILADGGEKMSKSKGNTINPDDIVETVGADALRVYEMFMGPFDQAIAWSTDNLVGARRFLERVERASGNLGESSLSKELEVLMHQTIKKVSADIEELKMNTAISSLMIFLNALEKEKEISREGYQTLLQLLAPFAPHLAEELWERIGNNGSVHTEPWPVFDEGKTMMDTVTIAISVNGKVRGEVSVSRGASEEEVWTIALNEQNIQRILEGKQVTKKVFVPNRLLNLVV